MANRRINGWRLLAAILMLASASLVIWGVVAYLSQTKAADPHSVEMMRMPGSSKAVPMPGAAMRAVIEQRMRRGDVPRVLEVSPAEINAKCRNSVDAYLLGCTVGFRSLGKLIFIRTGMNRELTHFVLVHEYAHALYGWKH